MHDAKTSVDRMILSCFLLGLSTRKVGEAILPILGEKVSASTVSRIFKILDEAVTDFHIVFLFGHPIGLCKRRTSRRGVQQKPLLQTPQSASKDDKD